MIDSIVVHINSKAISCDIIRIQPNIEYLLLPANAVNIINSITSDEVISIRIRDSIKLTK